MIHLCILYLFRGRPFVRISWSTVLLTLSGPGGGAILPPRLSAGSPAKTRKASHLNLFYYSYICIYFGHIYIFYDVLFRFYHARCLIILKFGHKFFWGDRKKCFLLSVLIFLLRKHKWLRF